MEKQVAVSVILPVYNVEKYIERCIESLQVQTFMNLEFIFVDDLSTDGSMAAVEAWAAKDDRVRTLYNKKNLGAGPSRNRGIEIARGEYLSFIDPDDFVSCDFYELLYGAAVSSGCHDIAKGRCCKVDGKNGTIGKPETVQNDAIRTQLPKGKPLFSLFSYEHWTAIWKRTLFDNPEVRYGTSITAQDTTFQLKACFYTNDIILVENAYYYYVQIPSSATHGNLVTRTHGEIDALDEKVGFLLREGLDEHAENFIRMKTRVLLNKFRTALGTGSIERCEIKAVVENLSKVLSKVPNSPRSSEEASLTKDFFPERPFITPGLRYPGEGSVRISVVLPVYNPGPGIHKCIESLRQQLLDGLEFIFVDDCSTDDSMASVEQWAEQDTRVHILRNTVNVGPGLSRNRGIEAARGDYLSFVDPDDHISPNFYELLYAAAITDEGHDIAKGLQVGVDNTGKETRASSERCNGAIEKASEKMPLYRRFSREHKSAIYRRSLFEDGEVRYGTSRKSEDITFLLRACYRTEDIVLEPRSEYYYHWQREGSIVNQRTLQTLDWELDANEERFQFFKAHDFDEHACEYLKSRIRFFITNCYLVARSNASSDCTLYGCAERLRGIVESSAACTALQSDCPYQALVKHLVPLPDVEFLPSDHKLPGILSWLAFIEEHRLSDSRYTTECSQAIEKTMRNLIEKRDFAGAVDAYSRILKKLRTLPPLQHAALRHATHRSFATKDNALMATRLIKQKVLGKSH